MDWKAIRRRENGGRGFQDRDSMLYGKDTLEDLKLKQELMKMMMEDHLHKTYEPLSKEEAEELTFRWMDDEQNEWTTDLKENGRPDD